MTIKSTLKEGILYTELMGVIDFTAYKQHIDFLVSLKSRAKNVYELQDYTNVTDISVSSNEIQQLVKHAMQLNDIFEVSYLAYYAPTDFIYGMARMEAAHAEISKHKTVIEIFRDKERAIEFLKEKMGENG